MKQPTFNGRVLLPMDVIEAARAGDPLTLERVLRYYDRYINKICTRTLYDKDGWIFLCGSTAVPEERIPPIQRQETAVPEQRYRT